MSNTYFYTRMIEMCQHKQTRAEYNNLKLCAQVIYQVAKKAIIHKFNGQRIHNYFYVKKPEEYKVVYSCVLMPNDKFEKITNHKNFIIPGFMIGSKEQSDVFKNFLSPFKNEGKYVKVLFKINVEMGSP